MTIGVSGTEEDGLLSRVTKQSAVSRRPDQHDEDGAIRVEEDAG